MNNLDKYSKFVKLNLVLLAMVMPV